MKPDNKFFSFMSLVGDLILLNVLFIATSIPVVTIGISTCALYASVRQRIRGEESYVIKDYFNFWKSNARNGLILWLILLPVLAAMLIFTILYCRTPDKPDPRMPVFYTVYRCHFYTGIYYSSAGDICKHASEPAEKQFPHSLCPPAGHADPDFIISIPICITIYFPAAFYYTFAYWVVLGFSITAVISVLLTGRSISALYG